MGPPPQKTPSGDHLHLKLPGPSYVAPVGADDLGGPNPRPPRDRRARRLGVPRPRLSSPVPPGGFPKGGRCPPLVVGGVWGRNRNAPRIFLRGSGGVFFQFGKNTSPDAAKHPWHPRLVNRPPTAGCGHPALRSSDGAGSKSRRASPAPPAIRPTPHFPSCNPERLC